MSGSVLRAAVVGAGAMGRNHVRILTDMTEVDLVAVVDSDDAATQAVTRGRVVRPHSDLARLLAGEEIDVAVVATPTMTHTAIAGELMRRGVHCLVEKPLAATVEVACELQQLAEETGVVLAVGHVERYNPAIIALKEKLAGDDVYSMVARRTGPFPQRIRDVDVITDLATHDVDVMRYLTGSEVMRVGAETAGRVATDRADLFAGTIRFGSGQIGVLDVNWLTPFKTRELTAVCRQGTYVANYLTQELAFYENAQPGSGWEPLATLTGVAEGNMIRFRLHRVEPLRAELAAFCAAVRGEDTEYVTAQDAIETLRVTTALLRAAAEGRTVELSAAKVG